MFSISNFYMTFISIFKIYIQGWECSSGTEYLPSMCKTLSPSIVLENILDIHKSPESLLTSKGNCSGIEALLLELSILRKVMFPIRKEIIPFLQQLEAIRKHISLPFFFIREKLSTSIEQNELSLCTILQCNKYFRCSKRPSLLYLNGLAVF